MADNFQDKTEEATPKKLSDGRNKGQVARSQDFTAGVTLFAGVLLMLFFAKQVFERLSFALAGIYNNLMEPYADAASIRFWVPLAIKYIVVTLAPVLIGLMIVGFLINVYQVGMVFSIEPLKPKWKNLNIFDISLYKKFFNTSALMRLVFGLSKLAVVGFVLYAVIVSLLPEISRLMNASAKRFLVFLAEQVLLIGLIIAFILIALGILDFLYQKWKFANDMKMTKQEVKDERKQSEGDAQVKAKIRGLMQSFSRRRMTENVPKSDVVIANPVHFAIAVKYDPEIMSAPLCFAKGARKVALAIKDIARKNKVPIVENPVLARGLYKVVEVGEPIPPQFYHAVAEVLAYVYRLNEKAGNKEVGKQEMLNPSSSNSEELSPF